MILLPIPSHFLLRSPTAIPNPVHPRQLLGGSERLRDPIGRQKTRELQHEAQIHQPLQARRQGGGNRLGRRVSSRKRRWRGGSRGRLGTFDVQRGQGGGNSALEGAESHAGRDRRDSVGGGKGGERR